MKRQADSGIYIREPRTYQGILMPSGVFTLSEIMAIVGVIVESKI